MGSFYGHRCKWRADRRRIQKQLAEALVEYETLDREEVNKVLRGEKLDRLNTLGPALMSHVDEPAVEPQSKIQPQILE